MLIAIIFTVDAYAQQGGWNKEFSSMNSDTLYIDTTGGAAQGNYFVRTKFLGDNVSDQVVWSKGGFDVPFEGTLKLSMRTSEQIIGMATRLQVLLHHKDTTIFGLLATFANNQWGQPVWSDWSGTLSAFDSLSIVETYDPDSWVFKQATNDIDNFQVKLDGEWVMFYDGGELGKVEGVVFYDKNQNGTKDTDEEGLHNWKMYLEDTSADSVITDMNGYYIFPRVPRGTYTLRAQTKNFWSATTPAESVITISTETMNHLVNFGEYTDSSGYYHVNAGWNIVSVPRKSGDMSKTALFPSAISSAYAYEGVYVTKDTLVCGVGYWLKFSQEQDVLITGAPITNDTTIVVHEGWNMIGSLTQSITVTNIIGIPVGMITSFLFGYQTSYVITDSLYPGRGYWIKTDQDGELSLSIAPPPANYPLFATGFRGELPPPAPDGEQDPSTMLRVPNEFHLEQNYPNPFNPVTTIEYRIPEPEPTARYGAGMNYESRVRLSVYNLLGQEIAVLVDETKEAGTYRVNWNAPQVPSGIYFYQLKAGNYTATKKMVLMK